MPNRTGNVELEFGSPWDYVQDVGMIIKDLEVGKIARPQGLGWPG